MVQFSVKIFNNYFGPKLFRSKALLAKWDPIMMRVRRIRTTRRSLRYLDLNSDL